MGTANARVGLTEISDSEITLVLDGRYIEVPLGLIREAWRTHDGLVGLLLGADVVVPAPRAPGYAWLDTLGLIEVTDFEIQPRP